MSNSVFWLLVINFVELLKYVKSLRLQIYGIWLFWSFGQRCVALVNEHIIALFICPIVHLRPFVRINILMALQRLGIDLPKNTIQWIPIILFFHFLYHFFVIHLSDCRQSLDLSIKDDHSGLEFLDIFPNWTMQNGIVFIIKYLICLQIVETECALLRLFADPKANNLLVSVLSEHYNYYFKNI